MPTSTSQITPAKAFWASIGIFVAAIIVVVVLIALFDEWIALIALVGFFVGIFALLMYSLKRLSDQDDGDS